MNPDTVYKVEIIVELNLKFSQILGHGTKYYLYGDKDM